MKWFILFNLICLNAFSKVITYRDVEKYFIKAVHAMDYSFKGLTLDESSVAARIPINGITHMAEFFNSLFSDADYYVIYAQFTNEFGQTLEYRETLEVTLENDQVERQNPLYNFYRMRTFQVFSLFPAWNYLGSSQVPLDLATPTWSYTFKTKKLLW